MADLQPPEPPLPPAPPFPTEPPTTTTATTTTNNNLGPSLAPKRQRRPSVRLGEIATVSYDAHLPRRPKSWKFHKDPSLVTKSSSKTRPLTNLVNGSDNNYNETLEENNFGFGTRKLKSRKPTKRSRINWIATGVSRFDNGDSFREEPNNNDENNNNNNAEVREFEPDGSESPLRELSPVHSVENEGFDTWNRREIRARVSESYEGVRDWLIGLGLGRYAPVFEIHEVDEEVLPMLTLEDLKDMGINAVGSRRKLYAAILKLRKGFS